MSTHRLTFSLLGILAVWPIAFGRNDRDTGSFSSAGSGRVQESCSFNTDCLSGMYCNSGICSCLSTYVSAEGYCYQKVEPGQPGCVYDEQCSAVWPEAKCDMAGVGTCRCGEFKVEKATRDGHVCLDIRDISGNALAITCPLPEGAGYTSALSDATHPRQPTGAGPVLCNTVSTVVSQTIGSEEIGDGSAACLFPSDNTYLVDLYDCIGFVAEMDLSSAGFSPLANGICCPNRAFTCIQPTATGPNPTEPRWWFNGVTGMCQQFLWDPSATGVNDHSPNNFRTVEHCESYCRDACSRGSPEYDVRMTIVEESPINGCLQSPSCSANYECKTIGSLQWCCPTVSSICGPVGGRPDDPVIYSRGAIYHSGLIKPGSTPLTRFFYDPDHGRCIPFTYYGAGGNYNNFLSRIDCELFCSKLQCERGNPLRIGEVTQACQTNVDCPTSHECKTDKGVCCPRQQTICTQQLRVGNCDRSVRRFWYNAATRECQSFDYTGCQGNDNNFETLIDCQNFCRNAAPEPRCPQGQAHKDLSGKFVPCSKNGMGAVCPSNYECHYDGQFYGCCPTKTYTCSLPHSSGITCGSGVSYKFYYNAQAQDCESFQYNGCDGNSNNFATRSECESYCGVGGCPNGGAPLREGQGLLISCTTENSACPSTHDCLPVTIGNSIANRCCPTRAHICSLPPQQGSSSCASGLVLKSRYYFNIVTRQCTQFTFNGCDGNTNNFETQTQCSNFCHAAACSVGDIVYLNPNNQEPIHCDNEMRHSCPSNFQCTYDSLSDKHVCCGATDMGVCPDGEKAYINSVDMSVRECLVNVRGSCPFEYLCRFNTQRNRYYCCGSLTKVYCPVGRVAFKDQLTLQPIRCTIGVVIDGCPENFVCVSNITGALQGYCCSEYDICPNKEEYYIDSATQMPRSCSIGQIVTCPTAYTCQVRQKSGSDGFCCKVNQNSASDGCPPGNYVFLEGNSAVTCDPFNPSNNGCPHGYSCQWSTNLQRYQCCGTEAPPKPAETRQVDGCPSLQIAYYDPVTRKAKTCTSATFSCPTGYFCQFSSINRQFQCCGMNAGCPNKQVAFIGMNGEAQECEPGGPVCSPGFSCQPSENNRHLCCTTNITPCITSQVLVGGVCLDRITIGGSCVNQVQCLGGSQCQNGICVCPVGTYQESGACLTPPKPITCDPTQVKVANGCLNLVPIGRPCTSTLQCQRGSVCQEGYCVCPTNKINVNDQCVPIVNGNSVASVLFSTTTPSGSSALVAPTTAAPTTGTPAITTISQVLNVCPNGALSYIKNGEPLLCMNGVTCPLGFICTFSKTSVNYYCCAAQKSSSTSGTNGCPRGTPLIFPQTQQPVACTAFHRCPNGYSCVQSTATRLYQCCTTPKPISMLQYSMKVSAKQLQPFYAAVARRKQTSDLLLLNKGPGAIYSKPICPSYLVYVELEINGKRIKRCESSCPSNMTPMHGICQKVPPKGP